jgi:hypothetical protein
MFSYLAATGTLVLRLPATERSAFLARYATTLHEAHGIVQKGYVDVPEALFADIRALKPFLALSHAYVAGLKPKPTRHKA